MSSLVQFVKSMRSYLELPRIQLIFLRKKPKSNHEIKSQRRQLSKIRYVPWPWTFYFQQKIIVIEIAKRHLIGAMASSATKNTKKKKKPRSKRRKPRKLFLPDLETQMRGGHEQQPQIAWETMVNGVKKLVIWLDLGLLYKDSAHLFLHIAICRGVQVPDSVNI